MLEFIGQWIWIIALFFQILSFLSQKDKKFFLHLSISSFFWWIHYFLLWLYSWAFVNVVDIGKNALWYKGVKGKFVFWGFFFLYLLLWFLTFDWKVFSLIPIIASLLSIYAIFFLKNENLRAVYVVIMILWLLYNFFWFSIPWLITDFLLLLELLYTYFKIRTTRKKYQKKVSSILSK